MMRKVIAPVLGAAALVVVPLILTATPAFADPDSNQLCSQNAVFGFSHGACVSLFESNGHSSAIFVSACKETSSSTPQSSTSCSKTSVAASHRSTASHCHHRLRRREDGAFACFADRAHWP
jgi:hypothetical protein